MLGRIHSLHERGYGFLSPHDDPSREGRHFLHARQLVDVTFTYLGEGDVMEFESTHNERGLEAVNVRLATLAGLAL
jgi:cold shock CspA family protein